MTAKIKARVWLDGREEPVIADVMNPGGWFGQVHVVQVAIANALNPFFVIEAGSLDEAIDYWADSDEYGHHINDPEADKEEVDWFGRHGDEIDKAEAAGLSYDEAIALSSKNDPKPEPDIAGNDSHVVNLDYVAFCKFDKVEYYVELDKDNWGEVAAIASAIKENED